MKSENIYAQENVCVIERQAKLWKSGKETHRDSENPLGRVAMSRKK